MKEGSYNVLGVVGSDSSKIERVYPTRRGTVECNLPQLHMFHHKLVGSFHVV